MANDLTGDLDVVAQFPTPTANRILTAMHRAERFPHSLSMRVDDTPQGPKVHPAAISIVDAFGDATVNQDSVGDPLDVIGGDPAVSNSLYDVLDAVVNADLLGVHADPIVPSHLKAARSCNCFPDGRRQRQFGQPHYRADGSAGPLFPRPGHRASCRIRPRPAADQRAARPRWDRCRHRSSTSISSRPR